MAITATGYIPLNLISQISHQFSDGYDTNYGTQTPPASANILNCRENDVTYAQLGEYLTAQNFGRVRPLYSVTITIQHGNGTAWTDGIDAGDTEITSGFTATWQNAGQIPISLPELTSDINNKYRLKVDIVDAWARNEDLHSANTKPKGAVFHNGFVFIPDEGDVIYQYDATTLQTITPGYAPTGLPSSAYINGNDIWTDTTANITYYYQLDSGINTDRRYPLTFNAQGQMQLGSEEKRDYTGTADEAGLAVVNGNIWILKQSGSNNNSNYHIQEFTWGTGTTLTAATTTIALPRTHGIEYYTGITHHNNLFYVTRQTWQSQDGGYHTIVYEGRVLAYNTQGVEQDNFVLDTNNRVPRGIARSTDAFLVTDNQSTKTFFYPDNAR